MKRLLWIITALLLTACSHSKDDPLAPYQNKSSAQIFNEGQHALAKGNYGASVKSFEALDAMYPFDAEAQQGQLDVIYAYYRNDDYPSALAAADRYIRLHPRDANVDYAYYMKGIIQFEEGFTWLQRRLGSDPSLRDMRYKKQAFLTFNDLVHLYPNSVYVPDAVRRMAYIRNVIAAQQVRIAQFYMERKAYVAAANRASIVVEHFAGSPQVIPALAILVRAYRKMGLTDLANQTLHILAVSYPQSSELKKLQS